MTTNPIEIIDKIFLFFNCPHCDGPVIVNRNEVNCTIFRHGTYKSTNQQVNPHLDKNSCDNLVEKDLVYGCCKPFRINVDKNVVEFCDYI